MHGRWSRGSCTGCPCVRLGNSLGLACGVNIPGLNNHNREPLWGLPQLPSNAGCPAVSPAAMGLKASASALPEAQHDVAPGGRPCLSFLAGRGTKGNHSEPWIRLPSRGSHANPIVMQEQGMALPG